MAEAESSSAHFIVEILKVFPEEARVYFAVAIFAALFVSLVKTLDLINFWRELKRSKLRNLEQSLNSIHLDDETKAHLSEEAADEAFYLATGFRLSRKKRLSIFRLRSNIRNQLGFDPLRSLVAICDFNNEEGFVVRIPLGRLIDFIFSCYALVVVGSLCLAMSILTSYAFLYNVEGVSTALILTIVLVIATAFMLSEAYRFLNERKAMAVIFPDEHIPFFSTKALAVPLTMYHLKDGTHEDVEHQTPISQNAA